jgi:hypothetical protein
VIQRDYIERLIEQCADALRRMLHLREIGRVDEALQLLGDTVERLLGPLRPMVERLEASSAVAVAGRSQLDRLRMYAALVGEEALIHHSRGDSARAYLSGRRALELYAAISLAGTPPDESDRQRMTVLAGLVPVGHLDARYTDELRRLLAI